MHVKELTGEWASSYHAEEPVLDLSLKIPLEISARLLALTDMYPGRTQEQLVLDLLTAALDELEEALPYQPGDNKIGEDEFGDPIFEDVGLTPRFLELTRYYRDKLQQQHRHRQFDEHLV
ncbi:MAG: type 1 pili tip component [Thioalkalispiraceae bacterium]